MIIIKNKYVPTTESINLIQRVSNWMEIFLKIFFWESKKIALFPKRQMVGGTDSKIIIIKMTQKKTENNSHACIFIQFSYKKSVLI